MPYSKVLIFFWRLGAHNFAKKFVTESVFFKHKVRVVPKSFLWEFFAVSLSMANPPEYVGCQGQRTEVEKVITPIKWLIAPW